MLELFPESDPYRAAVAGVRHPAEILARAVDAVERQLGAEAVVVALFSGGSDSMLAAEVARAHPRYLGAAQWDTGTGLPVVAEWSDEWAAAHGLGLRRVETPERFGDLVLGRGPIPGGFPGPGLHGEYQNKLKDRARGAFQKAITAEGHTGPIVYVSGIRAEESETRMRLLETGPLDVRYRYKTGPDGAKRRERRPRREIHVSPLLYLTNEGKRRQFAVRGWTPNPAAQALGFSAECMCLAHGSAHQEAAARRFDPAWGAARAELEAAVRAAGYPWGPGENPPAGWSESEAGRLHAAELATAEARAPTLFDAPVPMCAGACTRRVRAARSVPTT